MNYPLAIQLVPGGPIHAAVGEPGCNPPYRTACGGMVWKGVTLGTHTEEVNCPDCLAIVAQSKPEPKFTLADVRDLGLFQAAVIPLAAQAFPNDPPPGPQLVDSIMAHLYEEGGELAQAMRKQTGPRFGHAGEVTGTVEEVEDELGDKLFLLARAANLSGASLANAALRVLNKIRRRIAENGTLGEKGR